MNVSEVIAEDMEPVNADAFDGDLAALLERVCRCFRRYVVVDEPVPDNCGRLGRAHLTSEPEPLADDGQDDPRGSGLLRVIDLIDSTNTTPDERERLKAAYAKSSEANRGLLRELTARDVRIRAERGA